jgi:hypothetical protein
MIAVIGIVSFIKMGEEEDARFAIFLGILIVICAFVELALLS